MELSSGPTYQSLDANVNYAFERWRVTTVVDMSWAGRAAKMVEAGGTKSWSRGNWPERLAYLFSFLFLCFQFLFKF